MKSRELTWATVRNLLVTGIATRAMFEAYDDVYFIFKEGVIYSCATRPDRRPPRVAEDYSLLKGSSRFELFKITDWS